MFFRKSLQREILSKGFETKDVRERPMVEVEFVPRKVRNMKS